MVDGAKRPAPHLSVEGLSAGYGGAAIITEIDLAVGAGEVVAIVGPNGAGKSTLLKSLTGVIPVLAGNVRLAGQKVTNLRTDELTRRGVGYVPQTRDVFATLTAEENLEMGGYLLSPRDVAGRIEEVVAQFPILGPLMGRTAVKLSGGERKLVAIARVMMLRPSLYILDEPTAGLAPELADRFLVEQVKRLAAGGAAVVVVEQKAKAALDVADWGYVMVAGRIRLSAPGSIVSANESLAELFFGAAPLC